MFHDWSKFSASFFSSSFGQNLTQIKSRSIYFQNTTPSLMKNRLSLDSKNSLCDIEIRK